MKVLVAGDFCPQNRVVSLLDKKEYDQVLSDVKDVVTSADYSIVNLECPVSDKDERPIRKQGPNLRCTEYGIEALKWAGFNCVTLANNHFLDYGSQGVENTLHACVKYGLDYVGGGSDIYMASEVLYKQIDGRTVAIINCCEHEFSIATKSEPGSNPLNPIRQYYSIRTAKNQANYVLVIIHGGHEHYQLPSKRMQETYRFFIDVGADAVVNHHQHCFSGYEIYGGKPIFYGLGNFCFDNQRFERKLWTEGYMVALDFNNGKVDFEIIPYIQCGEEANIKLIKVEGIEDQLKKLNYTISEKGLLEKDNIDYYNKSLLSSNMMIEPISNRYIRALQSRKILPRYYFSKEYLLRLYNFLLCQAHLDKINYFLNYEYKKIK